MRKRPNTMFVPLSQPIPLGHRDTIHSERDMQRDALVAERSKCSFFNKLQRNRERDRSRRAESGDCPAVLRWLGRRGMHRRGSR